MEISITHVLYNIHGIAATHKPGVGYASGQKTETKWAMSFILMKYHAMNISGSL